ncbi:MAG: HlyD family secretion protein [Chloroflexi bacterium]|nr:HlyD family secretion protein [Chloroflexota bacterium]
MKKVIRPILAIVLLAAIAGGVWWWTQQQARATLNGLAGSGTIEAIQVNVGPEVSGRVVEVGATEGQTVKAGEVLLRLDGSMLAAQRAQAEAAVKTARAQRDQLLAGARSQQLDAARATITTTRALLNGAQADLDRLLAGATNDQIEAARSQLASAQARAKLAQDTYENVAAGRSTGKDFGVMGTGLGRPEEQMRVQVEVANAQVAAAREHLNKVLSGALSDEVKSAQARVAGAQAQLKSAQAQYDLLAAGPSKEQIAAADAAVAQAEAALKAFDVQADKLVVRAPVDGTVLVRNVGVGEILSPGASAFVLGKLATLQITVYLPESVYGRVRLGQSAKVKVDSYPQEAFTALVIHVADQAEFTPRNVQTVEGRRTTVYALKLSVPNPEGKLKPGMPADVTFE